MIYGNKWLPQSKTESTNIDTINSIAYDEYCNYTNLLESCTDENIRPVLEAQVQILYEVSIKDIIEKIKSWWRSVRQKFVEFLTKLYKKIQSLLSKLTGKSAEDIEEKTKKFERYMKTAVSDTPADFIDDLKKKLTYIAEHATICKLLVTSSDNGGETFSIEKEFDNHRIKEACDYTEQYFKDLGLIYEKHNSYDIENISSEIVSEKHNKFVEEIKNLKSKGFRVEDEKFDLKYRSVISSINISNFSQVINRLVDDLCIQNFKSVKDRFEKFEKNVKSIVNNVRVMIDDIDKKLIKLEELSKRNFKDADSSKATSASTTIAIRNDNGESGGIHNIIKDNFTVLKEQSLFLNGYMHEYDSAISGIASYYAHNLNTYNQCILHMNQLYAKYEHLNAYE